MATSPTSFVKAMQAPYMDSAPQLYSISEHSADKSDLAMRRPTAYPWSPPRSPTSSSPAYPTYPVMQAQTSYTGRYTPTDSMPLTLNRPRKLSGASSRASHSSSHTEASLPSFTPSFNMIVNSRLFMESPSPSTHSSHRPATGESTVSNASTGSAFHSLPGEVLEVIAAMLKQVHLDNGSESCATCYMRDLCTLSVCSQKWSRAATVTLYQDIILTGPDSSLHQKRFKITQGSRILLLRRTLRANPGLARLVRSLQVPQPDGSLGSAGYRSSSPSPSVLDQYEDCVASLIMACPNLERVSGPVFSYDHTFKKVFQALSTRKNLKEMNWLVEPVPVSQMPHRRGSSPCESPVPEYLHPFHQKLFIDHHRCWTNLTTLAIHCVPGSTLSPGPVLTNALAMLPSLQHLHLSGLSADSFNDNNLVSLPRLQSLSLSHITGITSRALSYFATLPNTRPLRRLQLVHTPLASLPALARILSYLSSLTSLSFVQSFPPLMPETDSFSLWMMPYLASASLSKLHWDITAHAAGINAADDILARSIEAGGFPALRTLRTPNDPEGVFQALCRPVARVELPGDQFRRTAGPFSLGSAPSSPTRQLIKSSTTRSLPSISLPTLCTNLVVSRLAAQSRIDNARERHRFRVEVTDESGSLVETFGLGGYVGTVGSEIDYHLLPDDGSSDEQGGLVDVADMGADDAEAMQALARGGCIGSWNRREGVVADRKEKESWWHTERPRASDSRSKAR